MGRGATRGSGAPGGPRRRPPRAPRRVRRTPATTRPSLRRSPSELASAVSTVRPSASVSRPSAAFAAWAPDPPGPPVPPSAAALAPGPAAGPVAATPVTGSVDELAGVDPGAPATAPGAELPDPGADVLAGFVAGVVTGGWVGGGGASAVSAASETNVGAAPVPNFQPSTSPSCTRVEPAPTDEYLNVEVPAARGSRPSSGCRRPGRPGSSGPRRDRRRRDGTPRRPDRRTVDDRARAGALQGVDAGDRVLAERDDDAVHLGAGVDDDRGAMRRCRRRGTDVGVNAAERGRREQRSSAPAAPPGDRAPACEPPAPFHEGLDVDRPGAARTASTGEPVDCGGGPGSRAVRSRPGRAVHSCGSAPVLHRLPPPRHRDLPGSGTARTIRGCARPLSSAHPRGMRSATATTRPWHSVAWLVWALAGAATVQLAPSPVYVALVIGIAWLIVEVHAPDGPYRRAFPALLAVGVVFALIRVVISALTAHNGPRRAHDPARGHDAPTPRWLHPRRHRRGRSRPPVAGPGLRVVGVMAVFGAFNAIASHYELVQSSPRAFHELGVVTTVALAFVPSTIESVGAVREADRARTGGRSIRRGRILRSIVPVLERGMERAVALSESMDARGSASRAARAATRPPDGAASARCSRSRARSSRSSVGPGRPRSASGSPRASSSCWPGVGSVTRDRRRYRHRRMAPPTG